MQIDSQAYNYAGQTKHINMKVLCKSTHVDLFLRIKYF